MIRYTACLLWVIVKVFVITVSSIVLWFMPKKRKSISNDVILITGGGRGIGRQLAVQFAQFKPKHIILWGRNEVALADTTTTISDLGVKCSYMICDVSQHQQVYSKAEEIKKTFGNVTILVNNAGVVCGKTIIDSNDDGIEEVFKTNTLSNIWTIKSFLPGMISEQRGHIVTMNSVLGLIAMKGAGDYCSSKFATKGLLESLKWELLAYPYIHMTIVHPYTVDNQMFSGIKIRFPFMLPPLKEEYVSRRTVDAVLTNSEQIVLPRIMHLLVWSMNTFPVEAMYAPIKFFGADKTMDTFHKDIKPNYCQSRSFCDSE